MRKISNIIFLIGCFSHQIFASNIDDIRLWTAPDHTRIVFDVSESIDYKTFPLSNPDRFVVDFKSTSINKKIKLEKYTDKHLDRIRYGSRGKTNLRVVLDLKKAIEPKVFSLKPNEKYGHRLVIDLFEKKSSFVKKKVFLERQENNRSRDVVVAIDAGHGGEDPGAIGPLKKTREKNVTLQIAKKLKYLIDRQSGMRAILTRQGDYYIGLRKRMKLARDSKADLFISIHADAFKDKRVRGSSVYVLSSHGATSEAARWLAAKENSSDLVGGVSLEDKDNVLASVLLDLSQSATQEASLSAAQKVFENLKMVGRVHGKRVQQAGFMVLKSPDIPSLLVETGFITNPTEEKNLRNQKYQELLAMAIMQGIRRYFVSFPPPGTNISKNGKNTDSSRYRIIAGDTLSEIAKRHSVSLLQLRLLNKIEKNSKIKIGQMILIPNKK
tara:strand:+ start:3830 stop:5149 length:1320 start_codon:yes stop_codon:yes gene_type:complete